MRLKWSTAMCLSIPMLVLGIHPLAAQPQPWPACPPQVPCEQNGTYYYKIDAATGAAQCGRRFNLRDEVHILLLNRNPFAYQYRLVVEEQAVSEPAITAFLGVLSSFNFLGLDQGMNDLLNAGGQGAGAVAAPPGCPQGPFDAALQAHQEVFTDAKALADQIAPLAATAKAVKNAYDAADVEFKKESGDCGVLKGKADAFLNALDGFKPDLAELDARVKILGRDASRNLVALKALPAACQVRQLIFDAELVQRAQPSFENDVKELEKGAAAFKVMKDLIAEVKKDPNAFYTEDTRGDFDQPTNVTVQLQRKARGAAGDFQNLGPQRRLNFGGGPRFTLSLGAGYSDLEVSEFGRVRGFERNPDGSFKTNDDGERIFGTVVGLEEDSSSRAVPVILLHGRVHEFQGSWADALHFTLGLSVNSDNKGNDAELLVGPSLSFARHFFLTVGGYYGKVQKLGGDAYLGLAVPEDVTAVPVIKERHWSFAAALSVKIR